jgi:hypothetical protein
MTASSEPGHRARGMLLATQFRYSHPARTKAKQAASVVRPPGALAAISLTLRNSRHWAVVLSSSQAQ